MASKLQDLQSRVEKATAAGSGLDNVARRSLHADIELLRLDTGDINDELDELVKRLDLVPVKSSKTLWSTFESALRFCGLFAGFVTFSTTFALPMLMLEPIDNVLVKMKLLTPHTMMSQRIKRFIAKWLTLMSGASYIIEGLDVEFFEKHSVLLTFSHASNLDAFLIAATCPVRCFGLTKKEMFCIPFFSWLAFATGGVPVDRNNREKAIRTLRRASEEAQSTNVCLAIAPEGTRSKTGQMLPFKKGYNMLYKLFAK
jgi:1-acyl-sn-glycerol-3-phosphate acyltransferase